MAKDNIHAPEVTGDSPADSARSDGALSVPDERAVTGNEARRAAEKPKQQSVGYQKKFAQGQQMQEPAKEPSEIPDTKHTKLSFSPDELPPETPAAELADRRKAAAKAKRLQAKPPPAPALTQESAVKKPQLHFEDGLPSPRHKKRLPARPVDAASASALSRLHGQVRRADDDNVGVRAANESAAALEGTGRAAFRLKRKTATGKAPLKPARGRTGPYAPFPAARKNGVTNTAKAAQKRMTRKGYAQVTRTGRPVSFVKRMASGAKQTGARIALAVKSHPAVAATICALLLLVMFIVSSFSSCSNIGLSGLGSVLASSYLAEDTAIDDAELNYTEWETDLLIEANSAEAAHLGYDEYRYGIGDVSHSPYELMAYLTAVYQDFTPSEANAALRAVFGRQYSLEYLPETETRYRTEVRVDPVTGEETTESVPYVWHILNVRLTANSFTDLVYAQMDAGQRQISNILMVSKGNRQYVGNVFSFNWLPYVSSNYGYRIHPISGDKNYHTGVDIAVAQGTQILAGHDGKVTFAGSNGGYGLAVFLEGETPAGERLVTRYAHCSELLVTPGQQVKKGDVIAKVGSTGNSTGPHLHLEVLLNGRYLNPLYFAVTGDDGSSYIPPGQPGGPDFPAYPGSPMTDERFAAMMEEAMRHLGKPYVFGASGPNSFDCSGFVCYTINHSGVGSVGRIGAQGLYNICTPVSATNAKPGDLIFFQGTYSTSSTVTHVGIYIGNGKMIHAGDPVQYADISLSYWQQHFYAFGRLN
jgi:murein DD-endopeptidase MepM/ murein hydrolase activator NlpD